MKNIFIRGWGLTKFGELWEESLADLGVNAAQTALIDSGFRPTDIDALIVANMNGEVYAGQAHLGALFADRLGLACPSYRLEAACASGGLAINMACNYLASGNYKNILVMGVEKMTDVDPATATKGLMGAADEESEGFAGATFPALYALIAREHFRRYGTSKKDLAKVAVKNHAYGSLNPNAQFQNRIDISNVLNAGNVAEPLGLFDCSPISDGAAAVVLSSEPPNHSTVEIVASAVAHDRLAIAERADPTTLKSTVLAAKTAYQMASIAASDISIAEVHDCFTIAEILAYEDLGFVSKGKGRQFASKPKFPVNTSGGLKACGHPVGATGIKQVIELSQQLLGKAGPRQIKGKLNYGLAHNVGGVGGTAVVTIVRQHV